MDEIYLEGDMIPGGGGKSDFSVLRFLKDPVLCQSCIFVRCQTSKSYSVKS